MALEDNVAVSGEVGVPVVDRRDRPMNRARDMGFVPFRLFADIDEQRSGLDPGDGVVHIEGGDLGLAEHGEKVTGYGVWAVGR